MTRNAANYALLSAGLAVLLFACSAPQHGGQNNGVRRYDSTLPLDRLETRLKTAIADNGLELIAGACGKCGIRTIRVDAPGTQIITVSRPGLMLEMLKASAPAGADPPLRFYLTPLPNGGTRLTYDLPSHALKVYNQPRLDHIGRELDKTFRLVVAETLETAP